jgi:hypothetical protein
MSSMFDGLRRLARLERNLGAVLVLTPLLLIAVDTSDGVRGSISAYYNVGQPWAFYVPLTVGAMLFLVNGLIKNAHAYNASLGLALFGVILFDHESLQVPHALCAIAFFGGNFVVMMLFSTNKSIPIKIALGAAIVTAAALWPLASLFWAEWVSLVIVATHFILASGRSSYRALLPQEAPKLQLRPEKVAADPLPPAATRDIRR